MASLAIFLYLTFAYNFSEFHLTHWRIFMLPNRFFRPLLIAGLLFLTPTVWAETTLVAVAANFTKPMNEIVAAFEKETGHSAKLSFGSSGKFVAQIENGAPFEAFLSAGNEDPAALQKKGLAVANTQFTYAIGKLVLWSATPNFVDEQGQILSKGGFKHLAIADPKLAPYGEAAEEVLKAKKLFDKLQPLFVKGETISQTFQFISTGNAELGFVALSQVIDVEKGKITTGSAWLVPENLHAQIRQDAILLKKGESNPAAVALLKFLKSEPALAIIKKYGYGLAN
jgi:molybdate transport system substrate-binding protein